MQSRTSKIVLVAINHRGSQGRNTVREGGIKDMGGERREREGRREGGKERGGEERRRRRRAGEGG